MLLDRAAKLPERPSFIEPFCQFTCGYSLAMSLLARTLQNATTAAVAAAPVAAAAAAAARRLLLEGEERLG